MTAKEFYENLKNTGLQNNNPVFKELFNVDSQGHVTPKEGVWFQLMLGDMPMIVPTNTPRSELEKFSVPTPPTQDSASNSPLGKQTGSPFTSKGYPYSKDLLSYDSESLGRAFFSDALVDTHFGLKLFDHADIFEKLDVALKDEPYYYKGKEIAVYVYTTNDEVELKDKYQKLNPAKAEVCLFAWVRSEDMMLKIKLGNELLGLASFDTATAMEAATKTIPVATLEKKYISAKWLIDLFGKEDAKLLDSLNVKTKEEIKEEKIPVNMVRSGEKRTPLKIASLPQPKKDEVTITIGLFFDGTGNNRYNTELIYNRCIKVPDLKKIKEGYPELKFVKEKYDDLNKKQDSIDINPKGTTKKEKFMFTLSDSFLNPYSNIVLLHDIYLAKPYSETNREIVIRQYIQGVGTNTDLNEDGIPYKFYSDDIIGNGFGRLDWGIVARTELAAELLAKQIIKQLEGTGVTIKNINFYIFGFSRGAASARHFANDLNKTNTSRTHPTNPEDGNPVNEVINIYGGKFGKLLWEKGFDCPQTPTIRFLGLFDTVAGDSLNYAKEKLYSTPLPTFTALDSVPMAIEVLSDKINLSLEKIPIKKVMHIQAMTEWRENFPSILSDAPNKLDVKLFGAHSDIGGGYGNQSYKTIIDYGTTNGEKEYQAVQQLLKGYKNVFAIIPKKDKTSEYNEGQIVIQHLIDTKPKTQPTNTKDTHYLHGSPWDNYDNNKIPKGPIPYFIIDTREISNRLSLVSFNAMWKFAIEQGVPFEKKNLPDHNIGTKDKPVFVNFYKMGNENDLLAYNKLVEDMVMKTKIGETSTAVPAELRCNIFRKYIHISSNFNEPKITFLGRDVPEIFYVNHPSKDGKRIVLSPRKKF